jgi:DNA primase
MSGPLDLEGIRARHPLPDVVGATLKLQRAGNEWKACCPFHADRSPSFTIFAGGQRFHCFGCGTSGDVFDFLQIAHNVALPEAYRMLEGGSVPMIVQPSLPPEPDRDTTGEAIAIWRAAHPAPGTLADTYLRSRGLDCRIPESIRFAMLAYGRGPDLPCLVALVASVDNRGVGVHRIFLRSDGLSKADVRKPKLSLGRVGGCAVRLAPAAREMIIAEGIEDALTLQQELGIAAWAAAGAGMMQRMQLPAGATSVIIGADRDDAGENAAQTAAERLAKEGRSVRIIRPLPGHKDFNAELQGIKS